MSNAQGLQELGNIAFRLNKHALTHFADTRIASYLYLVIVWPTFPRLKPCADLSSGHSSSAIQIGNSRYINLATNCSFTHFLKYKIEIRMRNHTTIPRATLIQHVAQCVPEEHTVALENPEVFILVEVFKVCSSKIYILAVYAASQSVCGVSVVEDYYKMLKFNVMEIAKAKKSEIDFHSDSRVINPLEET